MLRLPLSFDLRAWSSVEIIADVVAGGQGLFLNLDLALRLMARPSHSGCAFFNSFTQVLLTTLKAIRSIISICIDIFF